MRKSFIALLALALTFASSQAGASGFRLVETDNAGQGQAHAVVASVSDAAAVYYNPAAMTEIGEYAAKAGFQFIDPQTEYTGSDTTLKTANQTFAIPHVYVVKNFAESGWAVGFGEFTNFGSGTNWSINGPFRYVATDTSLSSYTLNLNVAKKLGDKFSAAVGVDYMSSQVRYDAMYPFTFFAPGSADGFQIMEGDGAGFGYNIALLFKPNDRLKIGFSYRSKIKTTFSGNLDILNFPSTLQSLLLAKGITGDDYSTSAEVDVEFPDILVLGIAYKATDKITIEVDVDLTGWSSYNELTFKFGESLTTSGGASILPDTSTQEKNWKDVIAYRLGVTYAYNSNTELRFGFYLDPSPTPDTTFDPRVPDSDRKVATLGVGYKASDNFTIDASYGYVWADSRSVDNDVGSTTLSTVDGTYSTNVHIFGVSVGYEF